MKASELQKYIDANYVNEKHKRSKSGNVKAFAESVGVSAQAATNWLVRDKVPSWVSVMIELMEDKKRLEAMLF